MFGLLPFLTAILFAVVVVVRILRAPASRAGAWPTTATVMRQLIRPAVRGALVGVVVVVPTSAVLLAVYREEIRSHGAWMGLATVILAMGAYATVVPIASGLGLGALGVRPAWLAALGAWSLLGVTIMLLMEYVPGGPAQSAWFYGLVAVVPYALASAIGSWVALLESAAVPEPSTVEESPLSPAG